MTTETNYDVLTGEVTIIELTKAEIERRLEFSKQRELKEQAEIDKALAKASAQAKLAALGLTEEEVASILG